MESTKKGKATTKRPAQRRLDDDSLDCGRIDLINKTIAIFDILCYYFLRESLWHKDIKELFISPRKWQKFNLWKAVAFARANYLPIEHLLTFVEIRNKLHADISIADVKKAWADITEKENTYFAWDNTAQELRFCYSQELVSTVKKEAKFWYKYAYGKLSPTDSASTEDSWCD